MNDKIKKFLDQVGYEAADASAAGVHLLRYFEREYGVSLLGLMEREWIEEQVEVDFVTFDFRSLRERVPDEERPAFDRDLESLLGE
jgi:hypothetical protein